MAPARSNPPKRPLSAYNLFYRYKRAKIIEVNRGSGNSSCIDKNYISQLVATTPGLESYPTSIHRMIPNEVRRTNIRSALNGQLFARDNTKRAHRKSSNDYKMSFVELNKIMVDTWKHTDAYSKSVFQELAEDGRKEYNQQLIVYRKDALRWMNLSPEGTNPKKPKLAFAPNQVASALSYDVMSRTSQLNLSQDSLPFGQIPTTLTQITPLMMNATVPLPLEVKPQQPNCEVSSPEPLLVSSIQPLPFGSFRSGAQSKFDGCKHIPSVGDYIELIATLNESLNDC